jgi:molecular chaperone GrpE
MSNPQDTTANAENGTQEESTMPKDLDTARAEAADWKDKYVRLRADMDNFRKMQEKRAVDRVKQEKKNLLLRVLEAIDDIERALAYQEVADRDTLLTSLKHLHGQLNGMLQREGVVGMNTDGESFNPHLHEAVERVDSSGQPEGVIVQEMQRGYLYGDELLRAAKVHVSSGEDAAPEKK